ncbi:hypothetical protein MIND_01401100 [Mycena indigotica]|uniref:Uncharacterized protein n=1 Tax=Mycena indigotica TaxID=2126181 RepID=A0A8H6RYN1_9AGAR|nr:uncharacterized protein MIND_01401100 [Mycena indigotica]KAF7289386.1 hypothetical protein MIND_01401100 [Mycena indigotica]
MGGEGFCPARDLEADSMFRGRQCVSRAVIVCVLAETWSLQGHRLEVARSTAILHRLHHRATTRPFPTPLTSSSLCLTEGLDFGMVVFVNVGYNGGGCRIDSAIIVGKDVDVVVRNLHDCPPHNGLWRGSRLGVGVFFSSPTTDVVLVVVGGDNG